MNISTGWYLSLENKLEYHNINIQICKYVKIPVEVEDRDGIA
jgi:hypothetical protein